MNYLYLLQKTLNQLKIRNTSTTLNLKITKNESGNIHLIGIFCLLTVSYIFIEFIFVQNNYFNNIKNNGDLFLCAKNIYELNTDFYRQIQMLNMAIMIAPIDKKIAIQKIQDLNLINFKLEIKNLFNQYCPFQRDLELSPFKESGVTFARNKLMTTTLRNQKWEQNLSRENLKLRITYSKEEKSSTLDLKLNGIISLVEMKRESH